MEVPEPATLHSQTQKQYLFIKPLLRMYYFILAEF